MTEATYALQETTKTAGPTGLKKLPAQAKRLRVMQEYARRHAGESSEPKLYLDGSPQG